MNKTKKSKQEKGITLIALIITIIVLLILAVVAITSISNSNIIKHAQNGKDAYEQGKTNETEKLAEYESYLDENNPYNKNADWFYLDMGENGNGIVYIGNAKEITLTKDTEVTAFQVDVMEQVDGDEMNYKLSKNKINKKVEEVGTVLLSPNDETTMNIYIGNTFLKTMTAETTTIKKLSADGETEKKISLFMPSLLEEFVLLNTTEYCAEKSQWDGAGGHVTKLTLPDNLQKIDEGGLQCFRVVEYLKIPTSVTYVGSEAFSSWSANQTIDITGCDTSNWDVNWKEGCNAQIVGKQ